MNILEFLKNLDVNILCALIAIIGSLGGVIIGGILTAIFTILNDYLKFNRDEKIYRNRKKEETYLELIKLLGSYEIFGEQETFINRELMLGTLSKTRLYNSTTIQNLLSEIVNNDEYWTTGKLTTSNEEVKKIIKKMYKTMKEELKIKE